MMQRTLLLIVALMATFALSACGPSEPESLAEATRTPRPTFTPTAVTEVAQPVQPAPAVEQPAVPPTDTPAPVAEQPTVAATEAPTNTPEPPTATAQPEQAKAIVNSPAINVRSGPGTEYSLAGTAERGAELTIQAKNAAGDWWQVCCVNGQTVWIAAFLVDTSGPVDSVAVASNIPAPPPTATPAPVQPTQPPAPTATPAPAQPTQPPAPTFRLNKGDFIEPRPNSNPYITFFGYICKTACPSQPVSGYKMIVEGPAGRFETDFGAALLVGDPGLGSEFRYNAKLEINSTAAGGYRVWVADGGGNQVAEAWDVAVEGNIRTFLPRWIEP